MLSFRYIVCTVGINNVFFFLFCLLLIKSIVLVQYLSQEKLYSYFLQELIEKFVQFLIIDICREKIYNFIVLFSTVCSKNGIDILHEELMRYKRDD